MIKELYDFPTELRPIMICNGERIPDRMAVVRTDTNMALGIVGKDYKIVPHSAVIETFDRVDILSRKKVDVCKGGAVLMAQYELKEGKNILCADVKVGDTVSFGIRVFNSMNSLFGVGFELNALRLQCKNGLVVPRAIAKLSFRHFQGLDVSRFTELIQEKTREIEPTVEIWKRWMEIKPSPERITEFFKDVDVGKRLTKKLYKKAIESAQGAGVWGLYQVFTHYITHELNTRVAPEDKILIQKDKERSFLDRFYTFNWN